MIIKIYFAHKLPQSYLPKLSEILISTTLFLTTSVNGIVTFDSTFTFTPADAPAELDVYSAVARVCDANGDNTSGSATYIRDNYLLTANSVADRTHVTFDGFTFYERDLEFEAKQIVVNGQNVDLKVIKLLEKPFGFETPMNSVRIDDTNVAVAYDDVFVAGWGVGNDPNTNVFFTSNFSQNLALGRDRYDRQTLGIQWCGSCRSVC